MSYPGAYVLRGGKADVLGGKGGGGGANVGGAAVRLSEPA